MISKTTSESETPAAVADAVPCSADKCLAGWTGISAMALVVCIVCIIMDNGNSAIAAAIIFATSIYGYRHEI